MLQRGYSPDSSSTLSVLQAALPRLTQLLSSHKTAGNEYTLACNQNLCIPPGCSSTPSHHMLEMETESSKSWQVPLDMGTGSSRVWQVNPTSHLLEPSTKLIWTFMDLLFKTFAISPTEGTCQAMYMSKLLYSSSMSDFMQEG